MLGNDKHRVGSRRCWLHRGWYKGRIPVAERLRVRADPTYAQVLVYQDIPPRGAWRSNSTGLPGSSVCDLDENLERTQVKI